MKEITKGIIALVIIVGIAASIYAYDIWKAKQPLSLKKGDFAELYYIGYLENHSVFASSFIGGNITYNTSFDNKNYTLLPLKIYMGKNIPHKYPKGWSYADLGTIKRWKISDIKGLYKALLGMKEGEEKIIKLNASQAFGKRPIEGLKFNTTSILDFSAEFEIVSIDRENETLDLKWIPKVGEKIPPSEYLSQLYYGYENVTLNGAYLVWKNATEIISMNETNMTIKTTPDKLKNVTIPLIPYKNATFIFYGKNFTMAGYNNTSIWLEINPPLGNFTNSVPYGYYQIRINGKVVNMSDDKIYVELYYKNQSTNKTEVYKMNVSRKIVFDRIQTMPLLEIKNFTSFIVENDLRKIGYSFHELAGETVYFRIRLLKIYRLS